LSHLVAGPGGVVGRWLAHNTYRRASALVVEAKANMPAGAQNVVVIPPGIDHERFIPAAPERRVSGRVISVGTLIHRKGYDVLIRAMRHVIYENRAAHLVLVGSGPLQRSLESLVSDLKLNDSVTFRGSVPRADLPQLLQSAEVFCHPARLDTFPLAPLEAMACGLPILVSSTGALPEMAGRAGIVHTTGNEIELARHLLEMLSNRALRESAGAAARARVIERFTWAAVCDAYSDLYGRLIHNV
jgi:glycosyltransferase involved in cell wall biosynthesis